MSRRRTFAEKQIHAEHWDAHETVLIRPLREIDQQVIQDELAQMVAGEANMKLALGTSRMLTMHRAIVSWTLTNEDGSQLPLSLKSIGDLAPEDGDYIYGEINALNQPISEEEKKASSTSVPDGSKASTHERLKLL